jgi:hypothetical protein
LIATELRRPHEFPTEQIRDLIDELDAGNMVDLRTVNCAASHKYHSERFRVCLFGLLSQSPIEVFWLQQPGRQQAHSQSRTWSWYSSGEHDAVGEPDPRKLAIRGGDVDPTGEPCGNRRTQHNLGRLTAWLVLGCIAHEAMLARLPSARAIVSAERYWLSAKQSPRGSRIA